MITLTIAIGVVVLILLHFAWNLYNLHTKRSKYYAAAVTRAELTGRKLIVIGDPKKGMSCTVFGPAHGYGDVCVDIRPENPELVVTADMYEYLRTLDDDSVVVYSSCVLEYVPYDISGIIDELFRVCGGADNMFIVHIPWHFYISRYGYSFQSDVQKNVIERAPPESEDISWFYN